MQANTSENDNRCMLSNDFLSLILIDDRVQNLKIDLFGRKKYDETLIQDIMLQEPIISPFSKTLGESYIKTTRIIFKNCQEKPNYFEEHIYA